MMRVLLLVVAAVCVAVVIGYAVWAHSHAHDASENWAIQGVYSQLDCHNQPGTHPDYETAPSVDADGNESVLIYFLGCK